MDYLFVCRHNRARSQMAEAIFKHYYPKHTVRSAGVNVINLGDIVPYAIFAALNEKGIDCKHQRVQKLTPRLVEISDSIITLCKKEICPDYLINSAKNEFWEVADPVKGIDSMIKARDIIEEKILSLKV